MTEKEKIAYSEMLRVLGDINIFWKTKDHCHLPLNPHAHISVTDNPIFQEVETALLLGKTSQGQS